MRIGQARAAEEQAQGSRPSRLAWRRRGAIAGLAAVVMLAAACEQETRRAPRAPRAGPTVRPAEALLPQVKAELLPRVAARIDEPGPTHISLHVAEDGTIDRGWASVGQDRAIVEFDETITRGIVFGLPAARGQSLSFRFDEDEVSQAMGGRSSR